MDFYDLNEKVIERKAGGKTIWQPRIECWLDDRRFRGEALPGRYSACREWAELYDMLGVSARTYREFNACLRQEYGPEVQCTEEKTDELKTKVTYKTPVGEIWEIRSRNTSNFGEYQSKWLIESAEDLKVMIYIEESMKYSFDESLFEKLKEKYGRFGLPALFLPRTTFQKLAVELAGVENAVYALMDYPDVVNEYFKVLNKRQAEICRIIAKSPLKWVNYGDNIHSKVLPPELFKKYILPAYEERYDILHNKGKKFVYSHFDGDVRELLPYMKNCFLDGFEALTPKPQGDVSLKDIKKALGNDIFLVDGLASLLFQDDFPKELLIKQTKECLNLFEGQLVLGISDEFSSMGNLERIELVRDMVEEFNAKH